MTTVEYVKRFGRLTWQVLKYYSFFHVGTTYLIPIGLVVCRGESMEPTLRHNDILLTEKSSVRRDHIKKDDLIVLKNPFKSNQLICKRVYQCSNDASEEKDPDIHVPYGYVYITGDNEEVSKDSRTYGPVPYGLIQSRVFLRIWPLADFRLFKRES